MNIEDTLRQAQLFLNEKKYRKADSLIKSLLKEYPKNIDGLYTYAVSQRLQGLPKKSLKTLEKIIDITPNFGRAYQETGYSWVDLNDIPSAGRAFERAVQLDTSLINSWKYLTQLYERMGNMGKYQQAKEQVDFLNTLPIELLGVISYLSEGKLADAERLCRHFLASNKTHVEGMRLLAEVLTLNKIYDDAEFLLESCIDFEPDHRNARIQYANILIRMQKFHTAYEQTKILIEQHPESHDFTLGVHASAAMGAGDNNEAIRCYLKLTEKNPENPFYPISLGNIYKSDGDIEKAVALFHKAYQIKPSHGDSYWSLANAKSYKFTKKEMLLMHEQESSQEISDLDRAQICFALGKYYEDIKDFEKSFKYYDLGNGIKNLTSNHNEIQLQHRIDSQIKTCTKAFFEERSGNGYKDDAPIFILGLPRAGSTLLEQILSSHSQVDGTMELHNILNLAKRLRGRSDNPDGTPRYPSILQELEIGYYRRFGEQFISDTKVYRNQAPFFIDKMPNNFFHIGLIKLILPNAKIIDARRHPMSCSFSCYKQLFGEGQEFTYGLKEVGNYYRQYVKLMDHWDEVLPGFVLRVQHEDVVNDLEGQVRRILDFCGLEFEESCVNYHKTERSIRTPSSEQVRQPIYKTGLEQWKNFEEWLDPLKEALGPEVLERYPID